MTLTTADRKLRGESRWGVAALGIVTWLVAALFFFPIFWMVLNSFKSELDANTTPKLFFEPTLDRWQAATDSFTSWRGGSIWPTRPRPCMKAAARGS